MITQIKQVLKQKGFAMQADGKTYRKGVEKIYWCTQGCGTNFKYSIDGKVQKELHGSNYNKIMDYVCGYIN